MNIKYKSCPEIIARIRIVDEEGDDCLSADKVTGIQVRQDKHNEGGLVQIDVRDYKRGENLIVEIELAELMAALTMATLNADRDT